VLADQIGQDDDGLAHRLDHLSHVVLGGIDAT
jgi:hypothetical protein